VVGYARAQAGQSPYTGFDHSSREFARRLKQSETVKVYAKLPDWFRIPTPLGAYIPDWDLLIKDDKKESIYFVAETKGSPRDLRKSESDKIAFGEKRFEALRIEGDSVRYVARRNFDELVAGTSRACSRNLKWGWRSSGALPAG